MKGDVFGWSPDIGEFVKRDGNVYTETGEVYDSAACYRVGPYRATVKENYADWTPEKREEVREKFKQEREAFALQEQKEYEARIKLVEQAKAKLTPEEWNALAVKLRK